MIGSFPAADVNTFQMFQDQSVEGLGGQCQRSVSPWSQQTVEYCPNYHRPAETSSRLSSDQYTPQEFPTVTKLPPRQLQWVTSQTQGYDMAATALSYDVDMIQAQGQVHRVSVTTSNTGWSPPPQFNQSTTQKIASAAADCSGSKHLIHTFQNAAKNYYAEQTRDAAVQSVSQRGPFTATSPVMTVLTTGQPCTSYCAPSSTLYSGSVIKRDPDGPPSDWQCTLPFGWQQQEGCSKSSPGQQGDCSTTVSPLVYPSTVPYTVLPAGMTPWTTPGEQKSIITPSSSVGESSHSNIL